MFISLASGSHQEHWAAIETLHSVSKKLMFMNLQCALLTVEEEKEWVEWLKASLWSDWVSSLFRNCRLAWSQDRLWRDHLMYFTSESVNGWVQHWLTFNIATIGFELKWPRLKGFKHALTWMNPNTAVTLLWAWVTLFSRSLVYTWPI